MASPSSSVSGSAATAGALAAALLWRASTWSPRAARHPPPDRRRVQRARGLQGSQAELNLGAGNRRV
eukprot:5286162-Prymnesium_polylepis.1